MDTESEPGGQLWICQVTDYIIAQWGDFTTTSRQPLPLVLQIKITVLGVLGLFLFLQQATEHVHLQAYLLQRQRSR